MQCGFTPQYLELVELQSKFNNKGFEVLAFPCNQFGKQEPGTADEIKAFAKSKGANFPLFAKIDVNGSDGGVAGPVDAGLAFRLEVLCFGWPCGLSCPMGLQYPQPLIF